MAAQPVRFYFDFISPYSWLALLQAEEFARAHDVRWELHPVVYGALLDATGLLGPAEVPAKRRYIFHDLVRCAGRLGFRVTGPPEHPFRSLEALRTFCLFRDEPQALRLAVRLADTCWGEGRPLTDAAVLADAVTGVGLDAERLPARIADPGVKRMLHDLTAAALDDGVFGVPMFRHEGELFWGHDRLDHLADRLSGRLPPPAETIASMLGRPRGADRGRSPMRRRD